MNSVGIWLWVSVESITGLSGGGSALALNTPLARGSTTKNDNDGDGRVVLVRIQSFAKGQEVYFEGWTKLGQQIGFLKKSSVRDLYGKTVVTL